MKAEDIVVLDVTPFCTFTDMIVLCTGGSRNHLRAIVKKVEGGMKEREIRPLFVEGIATTGWNVLDYGDAVVHIFVEESRRYYNLERLWADGRTVDWQLKAQIDSRK